LWTSSEKLQSCPEWEISKWNKYLELYLQNIVFEKGPDDEGRNAKFGGWDSLRSEKRAGQGLDKRP
jgi:hypothetical protein